jgi:hypothetical protein
MFNQKLETARQLYALGGAPALSRRLVARLGYHSVGIYELPLDPPPALVEARLPLTFRFLEPAELDVYCAHCPQVSREEAAGFLEDGNRCFAGWLGDRLVSTGWIRRGPATIDSLGITLELAEDEAYVHNAFTGSEHRGQRALPALGTRLANAMAEEGCRVEIALVARDNLSGVRNAEHIGHRKTDVLAELALGPLHLPLARPRARAARFAHA